MNIITIYLRLLGDPCVMLVEVTRKIDWDDHSRVHTDDDVEAGALREFVERASTVSVPEGLPVDVFISWFGNQGDIEFPLEFLQLIVDRAWPLTVCIND